MILTKNIIRRTFERVINAENHAALAIKWVVLHRQQMQIHGQLPNATSQSANQAVSSHQTGAFKAVYDGLLVVKYCAGVPASAEKERIGAKFSARVFHLCSSGEFPAVSNVMRCTPEYAHRSIHP